MKKRNIAIIMTAALVLSSVFTACGSQTEEAVSKSVSETAEVTPTATPEVTPEEEELMEIGEKKDDSIVLTMENLSGKTITDLEVVELIQTADAAQTEAAPEGETAAAPEAAPEAAAQTTETSAASAVSASTEVPKKMMDKDAVLKDTEKAILYVNIPEEEIIETEPVPAEEGVDFAVKQIYGLVITWEDGTTSKLTTFPVRDMESFTIKTDAAENTFYIEYDSLETKAHVNTLETEKAAIKLEEETKKAAEEAAKQAEAEAQAAAEALAAAEAEAAAQAQAQAEAAAAAQAQAEAEAAAAAAAAQAAAEAAAQQQASQNTEGCLEAPTQGSEGCLDWP